jgi:taurine transport system ATP-binding protein
MAWLTLDRVTADAPGATTEPVLQEISCKIGPGQLMVALGPSGCGKTTLLNLIAGFARPSAGSITLDGRPVAGPGAERGVVFQHDALLPWQDVLTNIAFGLQLAGVAVQERETTARRYLQMVDLTGYERHAVWQLSGGMRQRVGLARALAANPRVLLMDEPFGALDAFTREQMQALLLRIWRETRKQIFLITHDIEEAVFLATDVVLLSSRPGRIIERLALDFGLRYARGAPARQIKSDPRFIEVREYVLSRVFSHRERSVA